MTTPTAYQLAAHAEKERTASLAAECGRTPAELDYQGDTHTDLFAFRHQAQRLIDALHPLRAGAWPHELRGGIGLQDRDMTNPMRSWTGARNGGRMLKAEMVEAWLTPGDTDPATSRRVERVTGTMGEPTVVLEDPTDQGVCPSGHECHTGPHGTRTCVAGEYIGERLG